MIKSDILLWLSESTPTLSDNSSDTDTWSDVCSLKPQSSDESDYSSDDRLFFPLMQHMIRLKEERVDDYIRLIDSYSDYEFVNTLRVPRKTALKLIDEFEKSGTIATNTFGKKPLEPKLCFYIFLSFLSSTESLNPIATRFDISVSSTFRVIRRVIAWLLTKLNDVIKWPQDYGEINHTTNEFESKIGISNILGVLDCIHIKIDKPKTARGYGNTKGYHSIRLQTTIDANSCFTNIYCGEPGSSSSNEVLQKSLLFKAATQNTESLFPNSTFLIGNTSYRPQQWLVTPLRDSKKVTTQQKEINTVLHKGIMKISEKTFRLLKNRFKRLKHFSLYKDLAFVTDAVVAACILHNYCLREK